MKTITSYQEFLESKRWKHVSAGKEVSRSEIHPMLFDFQKDVVLWALRKGRCALFLDTGLGKTFCQLEWGRLIGGRVLIIAPLSVARQTIREGTKINVPVKFVRDKSEIVPGLNITNYEMLDNFDADIDAIILDESSILKSISGKTRMKLLGMFRSVQYKLCCTATPSPNDFIELGNHSHFLGIMSRQEMLSTFFINANKEHTQFVGDTAYTRKGSNKGGQEWRLKHHAEGKFFEWLSTWAMVIDHPSNLGYDGKGYDLPPLNIHTHFVQIEDYKSDDSLFFMGLKGVGDRARVRRDVAEAKQEKLAEIVSADEGQWLIWCGLNDESTAAKAMFNGISREVSGADPIEKKVEAFEDFQDGKYQVLISKPKIAGMGLNMQCANNMIFYGLNDSWESFYQAIRREWRFGQTKPVNVHVLLSELETEIFENVMRKDKQNKRLRMEMVNIMREYEKGELHGQETVYNEYCEDTVKTENYTLMLGDSTERLREVADNSVDLSAYSPPFADLFVYSNSERDLGNSRGWDEFFNHYDFIIKEVLRVTKPGRISCVHTSDVPAMANRDGYIGLRDFPGKVIDAHAKAGWQFVGRCFVQKNPQAQAIRVKSKALLFVQMKKDSSCSRPALIDQVLIFKKPGENSVPITPVDNKELDNEKWISWAHGIWTDINESDTLRYHDARAKDDEKHICPLQLGTIQRCIQLYSNPGETLLTPFMGIGSEAYMAVKLKRKAIGIELKSSYFRIAVKNIRSLIETNQLLIDGI
ncbi:MAG: DNA methyltransferase [Desulfobacterales bacterium]|nr:DNA methyltransferase [Desulfobacterales bacterium]